MQGYSENAFPEAGQVVSEENKAGDLRAFLLARIKA
jgi:hypothetical protein